MGLWTEYIINDNPYGDEHEYPYGDEPPDNEIEYLEDWEKDDDLETILCRKNDFQFGEKKDI